MKIEPYLRKWVQFLTEAVIIEFVQVWARSSAYILYLLAWYFSGSTKSRNGSVSDSFTWSWDFFLLLGSILNPNRKFLLSLIVSYYGLFVWYPRKALFFSEEKGGVDLRERRVREADRVKGEETAARMYWRKRIKKIK